ncbi:MAG: hypothetical protein HYR56_04800 [Acidobacteria bacterium]|nr:hypothetical protein [Acidobacteriota bacterium]MBI3425432.1 hypothetical protein [Acidobacteriota bacterium]
MRKALHCLVYVALFCLLLTSHQPGRVAALTPPQTQPTPAPQQPALDPEKTGPIRHYIMIDLLNGADLLLLDRWYITYHAPETLQRTQSRQTRYATFRTYALPPEEAKAMNMWQGRLTEIGFASLADFNKGWVNIEEERKKITLPKGELRGGFRNETVTIPLKPNEVFVEQPTPAKDNPYFRWIFFYAYPDGVSETVGEQWFHAVLAKELAARAGVKRFVTYRSVRSTGKWNRVAELWFDSRNEWKKAVYDARGAFTKPAWGGEFPFLKFQSTFIGENPDLDFLTGKQAIP